MCNRTSQPQFFGPDGPPNMNSYIRLKRWVDDNGESLKNVLLILILLRVVDLARSGEHGEASRLLRRAASVEKQRDSDE